MHERIRTQGIKSPESQRRLSLSSLGFAEVAYEGKSGHEAGIQAARLSISQVLPIPVPLDAIDVGRHPSGEPFARLSDAFLAPVLYEGVVNVPISIAHDGGCAVSVATVDRAEHENLRLGIDITFTYRMDKIVRARGRHVFSPEEINEGENDSNNIARRWATKEAVSKVLGTGYSQGVVRTDIVTHQSDGTISISLRGEAERFRSMWKLNHWNIVTTQQDNLVLALVTAHS